MSVQTSDTVCVVRGTGGWVIIPQGGRSSFPHCPWCAQAFETEAAAREVVRLLWPAPVPRGPTPA